MMTRIAMLTQGRLARPLMDGFAANGCQVIPVANGTLDFTGFDYLLLYGPMAPIGRLITKLKSIPNLPPVIFWYTEQMPDPRMPPWLALILARGRYRSWKWYDEFLLKNNTLGSGGRLPFPAMGRLRGVGEIIEMHKSGLLKIVCTFSQTNARFLARFQLPVAEIPIGFHPFFGERLGLERDIDVVFLGTTRDARRQRWIPRLEQELGKVNIRFVVKDGSPKQGYLFDRERTQLLNRTRIMLNVMRQPWDDALYRFLLAAANGVLLLSEPLQIESRGPLKPGVHFVESRLDEIVQKIIQTLDSPSSRETIVENADNLIGSALTMPKMTALCLKQMA